MFIHLTAINTSCILKWRRVVNSVHTSEYYYTRHLSEEAAMAFIPDYFKSLGSKVSTDYFIPTGEDPAFDTNPLNEPYGEFISGKK